MRKILLFVFAINFIFLSFASRKDLVYFQPADSIALMTNYENNAPKLQPGDILAISVTADDVRATQPFNPISSYAGATGAGLQNNNPFIPTYAIDNNGFIDFPRSEERRVGKECRSLCSTYNQTKS